MSATCKRCGGAVFWMKVQGKPNCFDLDGKVHWDTCSKRRWQQTKETGERFSTKNGSGFKNSVHGTKFEHIVGPTITGERYREPSGKCKHCVPPWEHCPGCPDRL